MKFSSILLFTSLALAAPKSEPRQTTVVGTITNIVGTLQTAVQQSLDAIQSAVASAEDNVSAEIEATITANLEAITEALEDAGAAITAATTGGLGGIITAASFLTNQQVQNLVDAVETVNDIVDGIGATIEVTVTDLTPDLVDALQEEIDNVKAALSPFLGPLLRFISAVRFFSATAGVAIMGLANAQRELIDLLQRLVTSIGLPGLNALLALAGLFSPLP